MEVSLAWVSKTSVGIAESTAVSKQKTTRDHPGTRAPRSSFTCPRPHPAQQGQPDLAPYPSLHNAHKIHPATQNKVKAESPSHNSPSRRAGRPMGHTGAWPLQLQGVSKRKPQYVSGTRRQKQKQQNPQRTLRAPAKTSQWKKNTKNPLQQSGFNSTHRHRTIPSKHLRRYQGIINSRSPRSHAYISTLIQKVLSLPLIKPAVWSPLGSSLPVAAGRAVVRTTPARRGGGSALPAQPAPPRPGSAPPQPPPQAGRQAAGGSSSRPGGLARPGPALRAGLTPPATSARLAAPRSGYRRIPRLPEPARPTRRPRGRGRGTVAPAAFK